MKVFTLPKRLLRGTVSLKRLKITHYTYGVAYFKLVTFPELRYCCFSHVLQQINCYLLSDSLYVDRNNNI